MSPRERPILFSGPMVRAILDGRKTQTRRVVKPQPGIHCVPWQRPDGQFIWIIAETGHGVSEPFTCPFGQIGDRLWVRETWNADWCDRTIYKADGGYAKHAGYSVEPRWRPSIHMPRWASRIMLEITDVRVQRLQEISEEDAISEGIHSVAAFPSGYSNRDGFAALWNSLAKPDSTWAMNPWVWAVSFRRLP